MITEDYVSFETAKLLKEKGFYGECMSMYVTPKPHAGMGNPNEPKIATHGRDSHYYDGYLYQCEAPTLQMAMKWLREMYGLMIVVHPSYPIDGIKYESLIYRLTELKDASVDEYNYDDKEYDNYEQACEAALKYCLTNLIK